MNYLLQAYACSPYKGGEYAVSWGWITHIDEKLNNNDVLYVVSLTLTQEDIKRFNLKHVVLIKVDKMEKYKFLNYNFLFYRIWQYKAYKKVRKLKIDVIHVYSLSDYRQIGFWYKMKESYKILGPVGGGQITPKALRCYDSKKGFIREFINYIYKYNLFQKAKLLKFDKIYACNYETQKELINSKILPDVPLNDAFQKVKIKKKKKNSKVNILFVGRLINKKGLIFLLDVLGKLNKNLNYQLSIYGEGEQEELIRSLIIKKGLENKVYIKGSIPYDEISKVYLEADFFIMPSLRESGGSVLIEAMAHELPVVALNMALPKILKRYNCGLFIDINQSKEKIINDMALAIEKMILNPELRWELGRNGYGYVNEKLTWKHSIQEVYQNLL